MLSAFSGIFTRLNNYLTLPVKGFLLGLGLILVILSLRGMLIFFLTNIKLKTFSKKDIRTQILRQKRLIRGPKVVVVGGGTGLSVLLRGLKKFTANITAIVTVADDGGGSGILREDLGMLPPGDIRNCILALSDMEPTMEKLLNYRFEEGQLKGQNFGNLFIASMNEITGDFESAIKEMSSILAVTGQVLPVSLEDITLYAKLENGTVVKGESDIPVKSLEHQSKIHRVFIKPKYSKPLKEALRAIEEADVVVLGPGSLYTSVIPNLLVEKLRKQIQKTKASKVYIPNIMTQPGETDGYSVFDHVQGLLNHHRNLHLDWVIANNSRELPEAVKEKYEKEGAHLVSIGEEDRRKLKDLNINILEEDLVEVRKDYVRHNNLELSRLIISCAYEKKGSRWFIGGVPGRGKSHYFQWLSGATSQGRTDT
ncbi:gluconeogenesis factor YvcK family protein [Isachenkonia alkalipeptolytica]|nr:gluconeogenesis factor YvcK family protein [Isachenkonia alkalipeptolytica]